MVYNKIWDFIGFSKFTGSKLNIQNGDHHWLNRSQNFDFQIALIFLFYIRFLSGLWQIEWFNKGLDIRITFNVAVPLNSGKIIISNLAW